MSLLSRLLDRDEKRTVTTADVPWTTLSGGTDDATGLSLSAVWACQTLIADSVASLPRDTYRKKSDGTRTETSPPVWVERPNPVMLPVDFETQRLLSILGWGNSYCLLVKRDGMVEERWPLAPWSVSVTGSVANPIYRVNGQIVPTGNIQHVPAQRLPGALKGMSVVEQAARTISIQENAEEYGENFFEHGAVASGVLEIPALPADVSSEVVDRLRDSFMSRHSGKGNAGRPMALTGGTKWSQVSIDPAAAQFLETRRFQTEEVCRWYRVPPHEIQHIAEHASQGGGQGIEQMSIRFAQRTLLPWTIRFEQSDSQLLPRGQFLRFNVDASIRATLKERFEVHKIAVDTGMATPNGRLDLEDAEHVPGGDAVRVPVNIRLIEDGDPLNPPSGAPDEPVPPS